jgi:excisionase family DNA binding protein
MPDDNPPSPPPAETLSARDAADFLGVTASRLERLRREGKIPAARDGWFSHRYNREELMAYAERVAGVSPPATEPGGGQPDGGAPPDPKPAIDHLVNKVPRDDPFPQTDEPDSLDSAPAVVMVNAILVSALDAGASEIHMEPQRRNTTFRIRVDGLLQEMMATPRHIERPLFNRVKVMASLNPVAAGPQTGLIPVRHGENDFDLRVSCVPTERGEKIVARVYAKSRPYSGLKKLGFSPPDQAVVEESVLQSGLFLMVGPPASGTTTTAYSLLNKANNLQWNTATFEHERTYRLDGLTQVYADARRGRTLRETLPVLLDQNPDTLFLGDIDDPESAALALDAAEQGVRVWATLHAPDAVRGLLRLKHLGVAPERIVGSVNAVCAQRLVRRLCENCKTGYEAEKRDLRPYLDPVKDDLPDAFFLYRSAGCDACKQTGYRGQVGVFEVLQVTEEIRYLFLDGATPGKLLDAAVARGGMTQLLHDFGQKAYLGVTGLAEGYQVLKRAG